MEYQRIREELNLLIEVGYDIFPSDDLHLHMRLLQPDEKIKAKQVLQLLNALQEHPEELALPEQVNQFTYHTSEFRRGLQEAMKGRDKATDFELYQSFDQIVSAYLSKLSHGLPPAIKEDLGHNVVRIYHPPENRQAENLIAYEKALDAVYGMGVDVRRNIRHEEEIEALKRFRDFVLTY